MNPEDLKSQILKLLEQSRHTPPTAGEIGKTLKLKGAMAKRLQKVLNELIRDGQIVSVRQNRYSLGEAVDLVTGKVEVARSGKGFVTDNSGGSDVMVLREDMGTALHGDLVVVRLGHASQADEITKRSGKVIRILERSRHDIVGTLKSTGRFLYVLPLDPGYQQDFYVPDARGAKVNDRVVVRFVGWENKHVNPEAEVVDVIGPADDPSFDTTSIIRQYGFKTEFPDEVIRKAESASALMDQPGPRVDLRDKYILTIDPVKSRDFDDALSLARDANGNRVLGVHIADVCHFVKRDSAMDREARRRGNSVYLPDKVIPMLPEQLSNGICSLNPGVDRLTFSAFITVDAAGNVLLRKFEKAIIRSKLRLTYEEAFACMDQATKRDEHKAAHGRNQSCSDACHHASPDEDIRRYNVSARECHISAERSKSPAMAGGQGRKQRQAGKPATPPAPLSAASKIPEEGQRLLRELHALAQQFRAKRFAHYALDLDVPENEIVIGADGMIEDIRVVPNDISHQLVEECMVAANEAVVSELANRQIDVIARVHEPPREEKIEDLVVQLVGMGLKPGDLRSRQNLAKFLKTVADHPLAYSIRTAVLRSMNRAVYKAANDGHYALAKKYYGHFTSPIRRYPDLILHRQLTSALFSEQRKFYDKGELDAISLSCTQTEQDADQAERELLEIKKYRYLEQELKSRKPRVYDAVVVSCVNFGMFVEVLGLQIQGLVHVSAISDRFVKFDRRAGILQAGKETYKSGRKIKVRVVRTDFDKRRIDFDLA